MTKHISCDLHDYFEIVCMRQSNVQVKLKSNQIYQGIAIDIKVQNNCELLVIELNNGQLEYITLTDISQLSACANDIDSHNFEISL